MAQIDHISFEGSNMLFRSNGKKYRIRTDSISSRLGRADLATKQNFRLSPEGFSVTWPKLQLEMTVSGLLQMGQATY
ncbi:MAG TPA: hypothetical protein VGH65_10005 [Verrucomicrobiaceae bacterium]